MFKKKKSKQCPRLLLRKQRSWVLRETTTRFHPRAPPSKRSKLDPVCAAVPEMPLWLAGSHYTIPGRKACEDASVLMSIQVRSPFKKEPRVLSRRDVWSPQLSAAENSPERVGSRADGETRRADRPADSLGHPLPRDGNGGWTRGWGDRHEIRVVPGRERERATLAFLCQRPESAEQAPAGGDPPLAGRRSRCVPDTQ